MTAPHSISTLAVSLAMLGLVAWMANSHSGGGRLFAPSAAQTEIHTVSQATAPAVPGVGDAR
jgi:hypothetical protein